MMFCVSVPVLSEQIQDVEPSVSTPALIDHDEGVAVARRRLDAIFMNAVSLPRTRSETAQIRTRDHPLHCEMDTSRVDGVRRDAAYSTFQVLDHDLLRVHALGCESEADGDRRQQPFGHLRGTTPS
jgi:hypothetical protein